MRYPLREWGFDRATCGKIIQEAGLPLPPKSACSFCPAMRREEIEELAKEEPKLYLLALEMERLYREGRHFRGDQTFTVTAKRAQTGEVVKEEMFGQDVAHVRAQFRRAYDDEARPYQYKLSVSRAVVGLGRDRAWKDLKISLPIIGDNSCQPLSA